jgi:putative hydrolase of the HAD superfamily
MKAARREITARTFQDLEIDNADVASLLADDYTAERHARACLFPGAIETLEELVRQGIPMALLTNGDAHYQRDKIRRFGFEKYFQCIVVEGEFGTGKPDPSVFRHALKSLQREPGEVWMIGDNLAFDIAPAQALGMFGVWVDHRRRGLPDNATCVPRRTVHAIAELIA